MCAHNEPVCGDKMIHVINDGNYESRQIRGLYQGETCNYRVLASCGAPVFEAIPGGQWSSSINHFNITWVEYEEDNVKMAM